MSDKPLRPPIQAVESARRKTPPAGPVAGFEAHRLLESERSGEARYCTALSAGTAGTGVSAGVTNSSTFLIAFTSLP